MRLWRALLATIRIALREARYWPDRPPPLDPLALVVGADRYGQACADWERHPELRALRPVLDRDRVNR